MFQVLSVMGEMDRAVEMLEKAKSFDSEERAIQVELDKAVQKKKLLGEKEKELYKRMLAGEKATEKLADASKPLDSGWVSYEVISV